MKWLLIVLVGVGVVIAIVIGLTGNSQSRAPRQHRDSLDNLQQSITALTTLDASASPQTFQSDAESVRNDWTDVKQSAQHLSDANLDSLDSAWDEFAQSAGSVSDSTSV